MWGSKTESQGGVISLGLENYFWQHSLQQYLIGYMNLIRNVSKFLLPYSKGFVYVHIKVNCTDGDRITSELPHTPVFRKTKQLPKGDKRRSHKTLYLYVSICGLVIQGFNSIISFYV